MPKVGLYASPAVVDPWGPKTASGVRGNPTSQSVLMKAMSSPNAATILSRVHSMERQVTMTWHMLTVGGGLPLFRFQHCWEDQRWVWGWHRSPFKDREQRFRSFSGRGVSSSEHLSLSDNKGSSQWFTDYRVQLFPFFFFLSPTRVTSAQLSFLLLQLTLFLLSQSSGSYSGFWFLHCTEVVFPEPASWHHIRNT